MNRQITRIFSFRNQLKNLHVTALIRPQLHADDTPLFRGFMSFTQA